ncbi:YitT family protein [Petroclostridium sp. X23]|uniref:YitT family protein n=1 Tax=Petroclostridium sp. X23 TaxID=3045146 RepID=UPI0024AD3933|nr:YitT family protein [Petroclostridium sp. X23]WHH61397.1 YitT family protein [Petroclostridium sp. X23]
MLKLSLKRLFSDWKSYFLIIIGSAMTAASINMFLTPNKIAPGGLSGIGIVLYYLFGLPVGTTMLVLNIPLFILGIRHLGGVFGVKTLFSTVILSVMIDSTTFLPVLTREPLLASIYGGIMMGAGLGLVFRSGATTGGTDLAAKIIHKFIPFLTLGQLLLAVDFSVIVFAAVVFGDYELALYAIITLFVGSQVIDGILEGVNFAKAVFIISNKSQYISERIMKDLDRGVTGLGGKGMYTGKDKVVLMCILKRTEIPIIKSIVKEIDSNAFVILTDVREVLGEGFKSYE